MCQSERDFTVSEKSFVWFFVFLESQITAQNRGNRESERKYGNEGCH